MRPCPLLAARSALFALALPLLLAAAPARAGERRTVWAYPPTMSPKGSVEVETWLTLKKETSDPGTDSELRIEVENALTDDVSLDIYLGVFEQVPEESFKLDRVQASLRANLLPEKARGLFDLTGYAEVKRPVDLSKPWGVEMILIAGKDWGRFGAGVNLVFESELSSNAFDKDVRELKAIATATWELGSRIAVSAEFIVEGAPGGKTELSLGPTLSVGLTEKTWVAIGPQFGLNSDADKLAVRAIFGVFF